MDEIVKWRKEIDEIDRQLLVLIGKRLEAVREIGILKKGIQKQVRDPQREKEKIASLSEEAKKLGISARVVKKIWQTFFEVAYILEK
ncbi:MAG: chorismate mutase [Patescibacteria group bacterium]|nr:chorismate mutase [Patescibacteria group bacterium]